MRSQVPEANWYPDPAGSGQQRWWDGERWTDHFASMSIFAPPSLPIGNVARPEAVGRQLPIRRAANAFLVNFSDSALVRALLASYAVPNGGVWVGGTATLAGGVLTFRTNSVNRMFHGRRADIAVQTSEIRDVGLERALVTDIIAVRTPASHLQFRCYRAGEFAEAIAAAGPSCVGPNGGTLAVREVSSGRIAAELLEVLQTMM